MCNCRSFSPSKTARICAIKSVLSIILTCFVRYLGREDFVLSKNLPLFGNKVKAYLSLDDGHILVKRPFTVYPSRWRAAINIFGGNK
nr:MAG TPA: hypothetical protein [Caudoviricetes sp.]